MAASMPNSIDIGDLVQDGMLGLIDAAHRFDEARGIKFETFAERRVRGAMIDALRRDAWPRGVRRQRRELEAAREAAAPRARRTSRRSPISPRASAPTRSGSSRTIVRINTIESTSPLVDRRARRRERRCRPRSCRPSRRRPTRPTRSSRPASACAPRSRRCRGASARSSASTTTAKSTMKQIGAEIGVNESRVSQLHARADPAPARGARRRCARRPRRRRCSPAILAFQQTMRACRWPKAEPTDGQRRRVVLAVQAGRQARRGRCAAAAHRQRSRDAVGARDRRSAVAALEPSPSSRHLPARPRSRSRQPERLGEPAAAALFEELLGVGAGDVAGDEDDRGASSAGCVASSVAVERLAVEPRHLQVADDQIEVRCR